MNRRTLITFALAAAVVLPARADRVNVEGQWFDKTTEVAGTPLRLNGTGVRAVAWFKGFAAGLYLTTGDARTASQALAAAGPKRLQMRMLQEVPAAEFSKAVRKGVARNSSAAEQAALAQRLVVFESQVAALRAVRPGDVVDLDLDPGRGLQLRLNGQPRGTVIAGDDFYAAVLRSFLGDKPYDDKLKAGLLGGTA
jgi:flagellar motor switch/type III secretory pathway protein FliN